MSEKIEIVRKSLLILWFKTILFFKKRIGNGIKCKKTLSIVSGIVYLGET